MSETLNVSPVKVIKGLDSIVPFFENLKKAPKALLITTEGMVKRRTVAKLLGDAPECFIRTIASNPDLDAIDAIRAEFENTPLNLVVGMGGGSALDTAKLIAFLLSQGNNGLTLSHLLRESGDFKEEKLPLTLIPTTSGTGSEVTPYACVWDKKEGAKKYKYTFANKAIYATTSYLDPRLTLTVPRQATLYAALDTCSHAIETLWNKNATPDSVAFANQALTVWVDALPQVLNDLHNIEARALMQEASVLAGRAISISKTAIAHSISYPITQHFGVPHGLACSFALKKLADKVTAKNLWMKGSDIKVIENVMALFATLGIDEAIDGYCTAAERRSYTGEMFTPGRSDSFVLSEADVVSIF